MALAPLTKRVYQSAQKRFLDFCMAAKLTPFPLLEELLCYISRPQHSSLKSYLSSLRHMQISYGLEDPFTVSMPRLEQVVKGIKVNQGRQGCNTPNQKLPVTPTILRQLKGLGQQREQEPDYIMMWAACCVCFLDFCDWAK